MRVCGIICEYDPFHSGHLIHINKTRDLLGPDTAVVCCMSGNYTQRGEPAILPKHLRAEAALRCGADLLIELPSAYSLLSAEGFAFSAVYLLSSLGVVTDISFGAETDDDDLLYEIASLLSEHETAQKTLLCLKSGISYAAAREKALYGKIKEKSLIISQPNNILAIEYIKALLKIKSDIVPHAVKRIGAPHDSKSLSCETVSASAIRDAVRRKDIDSVASFMPEQSLEILRKAMEKGLALTDQTVFERTLYTYLLRSSKDDFLNIPDVSEGLENRLYSSLHNNTSADIAALSARSKRYPLSRIKRIMLRAFLDLDSEYSSGSPPYCRILGFNEKGRSLLSLMRDGTKIPVITKAAHIKRLSEKAIKLFEAEANATDLYNAALPDHTVFPNGYDWSSMPVII